MTELSTSNRRGFVCLLGASLALAGGVPLRGLEVKPPKLRWEEATRASRTMGQAGFSALVERKAAGPRKLIEPFAPGPYSKMLASWKTSLTTGGGAGIADTPCEACPATPIACGVTAAGMLAGGDCALNDGSFFDLYRLVLEGPRIVTINQVSSLIDSFLFLVDDACDVVAFNDDCSPGSFSSCLAVTVPAGTYYVVANSYSPGETGPYDLQVTCEEPRACIDCLAGDIACGTTRSGSLAEGDCTRPGGQLVDIYRFVLADPALVRIELRSVPLDPVLFFLDGDCVEVAANDDCTPNDLDLSCLSGELPAGTYHIGVSSLEPGERGDYELEIICPDTSPCRGCEVGTVACGGVVSGVVESSDCVLGGFPADVWRLDVEETMVLDVSLTSGANLALEILDASCTVMASNDECSDDDFESCLAIPQLAPGSYHIRVKGAQASDGGPYDLRVDCAPFDPCGSCLEGPVACGGSVTGALEEGDCFLAGDGTLYDIWSLHLDEPLRVSIDLESPDFDAFIFLLDAACGEIAFNNDCSGSNACLVVDLPAGDYLIVANSFSAATGTYTLTVSCAQNPICELDCRAGEIACGEGLTGELTAGDCPLGDGTFLDAYSFNLVEPQRVTFTLESTAFNAFFILFSSDCTPLAANNDCVGTNSCMTVDLPAGEYILVANSFEVGETGPYSLGVECASNTLCTECRAGTVPCNGAVSGTLPTTGCRHPDGSFIDIYDLNLLADSQVEIQLNAAFDTFLFLVDSDCNLLATNDDCTEGELQRSCISVGLTAGTYALWVNSVQPGETGDYTLEVASTNCAPCEACQVGTIACNTTVEGSLPESGCQLPGGLHVDLRELTVTESGEVTITVESDEFDPSLTLHDESCSVIASNDDCNASTLGACVTLLLEPGTYSVAVNNFLAGESGAYRLSVDCGGEIKPGDCNADGAFNISDGICVLGYLFSGVPGTLPCGDQSRSDPGNISLLDFNESGGVDISDAIAMFLFLFLGGPGHPLGPDCVPIAGCGNEC